MQTIMDPLGSSGRSPPKSNCLALLFLILLLPTLAVAANPAIDLPSAARLLTHKPGLITVSIWPQQSASSRNALAFAELRLCPAIDVDRLDVLVTAAGPIDVDARPITLKGLRGGIETKILLPYVVRKDGVGEIRATVKAGGTVGPRFGAATAVLYIVGKNGKVFASNTGFLDLQITALDAEFASGNLDKDSYATAVRSAEGGGATFASHVQALVGDSVTVSGHVRWTDSAGNTHPVRLAPVQLIAGHGSPNVLAAGTTDEDGSYALSAPWPGAAFVRVLASGPGFSIKTLNLNKLEKGSVHRIDSLVFPAARNSSLTLDITANNRDDNDTAFSVADALLTAVQYAQLAHGSPMPDVVVYYPGFGTFYVPSLDALVLLRLDRFDWDVILHEFGHHVSDQLGLDQSPGGGHGPGNMGEFYPKDTAVRLAWGEGWPTYFSISLQTVMGTAGFGIPRVGDTHYSDTEDFDLDYDLETQTGGFESFPGYIITSLGEDDEISVQRILWDLFDEADDDGDSGVALGDQDVWNVLDAYIPATLSDAHAAFLDGESPMFATKMGCIFSAHRVAPDPITPAEGTALSATPPTFTWAANGGGPSNRNNDFVVEVYDASFTHSLLVSAAQPNTSFTPTQNDWDVVLSGAGGAIHWFVSGAQTNLPPTGPYSGCSLSMIE